MMWACIVDHVSTWWGQCVGLLHGWIQCKGSDHMWAQSGHMAKSVTWDWANAHLDPLCRVRLPHSKIQHPQSDHKCGIWLINRPCITHLAYSSRCLSSTDLNGKRCSPICLSTSKQKQINIKDQWASCQMRILGGFMVNLK